MTDRWIDQDGAPGGPADDPIVGELLRVSAITLATAGSTGAPHAAAVYFAALDDLSLAFLSDPATMHVRHATEKDSVAAEIHPEASDWAEIRGLQLTGRVRPANDPPLREAAWDVYERKFPFVRGLRDVVAAASLFVLVPTWIRLIDNRQGFSFKREWVRSGVDDPR